MEGAEIRRLVDGAAYRLSKEYEMAMIEQKTAVRTPTSWIEWESAVTHGPGRRAHATPRLGNIEVGLRSKRTSRRPTGRWRRVSSSASRGPRMGSQQGRSDSAQLGCIVATMVIERSRTQGSTT